MEEDYSYELLPTAFPDECDVNDKNLANVEFLYASKIIGWPNFTHCLPSCGLCTSFASDQTYLHYNLFVIGILLPFISFCGLFGNGLSAFLYSRRMLSTSTNIYLCALGVSDCGVIVTAIFLFFIDSVRRYSLTLTRGFGMFSPVVYPAGMIAQTCSVYFTLAAATDCFVRVIAPESWRAVIGKKKFYRSIIVAVVVWSVVYNLPHFFEAVLLHCWHSGFDDWSVEVCPEPFRFHPTYIAVYYKYMYSLFLAVGPLVVLIVLNAVIFFSSFVIHSNDADAGENVALVLVVLLFISCNTIALLINVFETRLSLSLGWRINYIIDISNLLVVFNSSFNFVIYYNFSAAFRSAFHHYFGGHNKDDSQCKTVLIRDSSGDAPILVTSNSRTPAVERQIVLQNNYANELDVHSPEDCAAPRNSMTRLLSHSASEVLI